MQWLFTNTLKITLAKSFEWIHSKLVQTRNCGLTEKKKIHVLRIFFFKYQSMDNQ